MVGFDRCVLAALCLFAVSSGAVMSADDATTAKLAMSGKSTVRGGLSEATEDLASLNSLPRGKDEAAAAAGEAVSSVDSAAVGGGHANVEQEATLEFKAFIEKHKKSHKYCPGLAEDKLCVEALLGKLSFLENKAIIEAHNALPDATFTMGLTPFADYTGEEFIANNFNYKSHKSLRQKRMEKRAGMAAARDGVKLPGGGVVSPSGHLGVAKNANPDSFPKAFNWADVPEVMGKVHTQETSCASCWAYTSTDTIEAIAVISGRQKTHVELSAEQLINCDGHDSGCNTGNMFTAYEWIDENGGLATAQSFHAAVQHLAVARSAALTSTELSATSSAEPAPVPVSGGFDLVMSDPALSAAAAVGDAAVPRAPNGFLTEEEDEVAASAAAFVGAEREKALRAKEEKRALDAIEVGLGTSSGYCPTELPLQDKVYGYCELDFEAGEAALMEAVAKQPVAIGINANTIFQLYASGIIRAADCGPAAHTQDSEIMSINHAVVVTGWGETHVNGKLIKYWVLKNSFGESWGEKGYFKLERGAHTLDDEGFGTCGMYFESVYPVLDENASKSSCIPGCTFRTKYYSAAAVLGADKVGRTSAKSGRRGTRELAAVLMGVGFIAAVTAAVRRLHENAQAEQEEGASLLPQ